MTRYALLIAIIFSLLACRKYDEGPAFSLRSKKQRLANVWKIETYLVNGEDKTSTIDSMYLTFEFRKDGAYQELMSHSHMYYIDTGRWKFIEDKEAIEIYRTNDTITWQITRLEEKELWAIYTPLSFFRFEYHLKPVE